MLEIFLNVTGWWYTYPSEKYEFVSWDSSSELNGKIKKFQTSNQCIATPKPENDKSLFDLFWGEYTVNAGSLT